MEYSIEDKFEILEKEYLPYFIENRINETIEHDSMIEYWNKLGVMVIGRVNPPITFEHFLARRKYVNEHNRKLFFGIK